MIFRILFRKLLFISLNLLYFPVVAQYQDNSFIEKLLKKHPERFDVILREPDKYHIQILYTRIDRNRKNEPHFSTFGYRVDKEDYFYPASTVKLPVVALALEKLNRMGIDKYTPMLTEADGHGETAVTRDSSAENGLPSVGHYAKKILLASDNDAYNRLYEFLGQEAINDSLHAKGYKNVRLSHRLQLPLTPEENRYTNPINFRKDEEGIFQPGQYSSKTYWSPTPILRGKGYMENGQLVSEPFDFTKKNFFALEDQHRVLKALYFPESVPAYERFNLKPEDYTFLYQYMSQFPVETSYPASYTDDYYDGFCKFLLFGATKTRLPRHIRLFNKCGDAYGYLLDNAYIADFEKGIEFMVTAVIYCNSDEIFNDDQYDYDTVGLPFMANLGKTFFEYELSRKHTNRPDLERFEVQYDK